MQSEIGRVYNSFTRAVCLLCLLLEPKRRRNVPGRSGSVRETWHPTQLTGRAFGSCTPQTDYKVRVGPGSHVGLCMLEVTTQKRPF